MSETAFGPVVSRAMRLAERGQAREAREERAERESRAAAREAAALELARADAESRGQYVSPLDEFGARSAADVLAEALAMADGPDRDPLAPPGSELNPVLLDPPLELRLPALARSAPADGEYEAARQLRQARANHVWLVEHLADRDYRAAEAAARAKARR